MTGSSIPNLLSLRGSSRGSRGRFRGRGAHSLVSSQDHDATIQGTDTDAAVSRLSAVDVGLLIDPFAQYFVQSSPAAAARRLPIINRGTYTRTAALDNLVAAFLASSDSKTTVVERQIVSLGAGTDTRACRLFSQTKVRGLTYHEVDFPTICIRKLNTVKATPLLRKVLPNPTVEAGGSWHVSFPEAENEYWCHGLDLRTFASEQAANITDPAETTSTAPTPGAGLPGLRTDVPTLLISECCLCYLQTAEAVAVVKWFTDRITDLGIVLYEPVRPDDAFGKTMVTNLASRGIVMPTLDIYRDAGDQAARLITAGFQHAKTMTVDEIWDEWVLTDEKDRVNRLEGLDEVEEWKLLAGHYIVAWGWRGKGADEWKTL